MKVNSSLKSYLEVSTLSFISTQLTIYFYKKLIFFLSKDNMILDFLIKAFMVR